MKMKSLTHKRRFWPLQITGYPDLLVRKTETTCRGTPGYMAPEIQVQKLKIASLEDPEKADIWSLELLMYSLINPNLCNPYQGEFERAGIPFAEKALKDL